MSEKNIEHLLQTGVINLDKPMGPTSHQVTAWVRDILGVEKAGHGGTLDPRVTGVLPIALNDATKALETLLVGDKEYVCVMHLHKDVENMRITSVCDEFVGEIYQTPPVRAAVKRQLRKRQIYELKILEISKRDVLFIVICESGTYIRTLCDDIGEALGVGAHLTDLRRIRTADFHEKNAVTLHILKDAVVDWKERRKEAMLLKILLPLESLLKHIPKVIVKDSAVDAVCHGADLAIPGILNCDDDFSSGDLCAMLTRKDEGIAIGNALLSSNETKKKTSGIAIDVKRVLMEPGTYPKGWVTKMR